MSFRNFGVPAVVRGAMAAIALAASPALAQEMGAEAEARYATLAQQEGARAGDPGFAPSRGSAATVRGANDGLARADALRSAQLALIDSDLPDAANPAVWAPFVLVEN